MTQTEQQNTTNYDDMFAMHERSRDKRRANANAIVRELSKFHAPKTVIDLGCGKGHFLAEMQARGADIAGVDGDWVSEMDPDVDMSVLQVQDLESRYSTTKRYDLAVSLEVGEHLSPARSETFVKDLTALSDHVLFSAAVPGQKGQGHINCRWQGEWAEMFDAEGYECYDPFRRRLIAYENMAPWFCQNLLFFVKAGTDVSPQLAEHCISPVAASYLLPRSHLRPIRTLQRVRRQMLAQIEDLHAILPPRTEGLDDLNRPAVLKAARKRSPDSLCLLKGMKRQLEIVLNAEGIFHFDQIAKLSEGNIAWLRTYCSGFSKETPIEIWVEAAKARQAEAIPA